MANSNKLFLAIAAAFASAVALGLAGDSGMSDIDLRRAAADCARSELTEHGAAPRIDLYWRASGLTPPYPHSWCGAFVLWALKCGGMTVHDWVIGLGFVAPERLPLTRSPRVADILYIDQPWQHYGLVVAVNDADGTVTTIEGNTPLISIHTHPIAGHTYYSIERIIHNTLDGPGAVHA